MTLLPLRDLVYILPLEDPEMIGSLYLPDKSRERVAQGIVKYRGDAVMELRVGDHVGFSVYDGNQLAIEGEGVLYVMREMDIKVVFGDEEPVKLFTDHHFERWLNRLRGDMETASQMNSIILDHKWIADKLRSYMADHVFEELW